MHWVIAVLVLLEKYMIWQVQAASCKDDSSTCGKFALQGYCKDTHPYSKLVKVICCQSCQACSDKYSNCPKYAESGYCPKTHKYGRWMAKFCCKSCKKRKQLTKPKARKQPQPRRKQSGTNKLKDSCVKSVNSYRAKHINTPPLKWDERLAARAQAYANVLKRRSLNKGYVVLEHDTKNNERLKMGENLWYQDTWKPVGTCADADKDWYSEIKDWSYASAQSTRGPTGHFTQMVWRSTTRFGVGIATFKSMKYKGNKVTIIVAKYQVRGNFHTIGQRYEDYTKNVQPLKASNDVMVDDVLGDVNKVAIRDENELETLFE